MRESVVTFTLSGRSFAVNLSSVSEILRYCRFTPIPGVENHVKGLLNLRGSLLAVVCPRVLLDIEEKEPDVSPALVLYGASVVQSDGTRSKKDENLVALLVDEIGDIVAPDDCSLHSLPANVPEKHRAYLSGVIDCKTSSHTLINVDMITDSQLTIEKSEV